MAEKIDSWKELFTSGELKNEEKSFWELHEELSSKGLLTEIFDKGCCLMVIQLLIKHRFGGVLSLREKADKTIKKYCIRPVVKKDSFYCDFEIVEVEDASNDQVVFKTRQDAKRFLENIHDYYLHVYFLRNGVENTK